MRWPCVVEQRIADYRHALCCELQRLDELSAHFGREWDPWFRDAGTSDYSAAERLVFHLQPEHHGDRKAVETFWERLGTPEPDAEYVQAFAQGALDAWHVGMADC